MTVVVYNPKYDIRFGGLERLHPFDSRKYSRAYASAKAELGQTLTRATVDPEVEAPSSTLSTVHTQAYLQELREPSVVAAALELGFVRFLPIKLVDRYVLAKMRLATAGTILAAEAAMERGLAINLSGGYHHAKRGSGEGFCVYNDIAIAIRTLRAKGLLTQAQQVLYVDLDAHMGNGVAEVFADDRSVILFDMFNRGIYPAGDPAQARLDFGLALDFGIEDSLYLSTLQRKLPEAIDGLTHPGFAIYNAGTDVFEGDPLGGMKLSEQAILQRDRFVLRQLRERGIPTMMLPSGGYTRESHRFLARTVCEAFAKVF